jgi:hypothetical protein
MHSNLTVDFFYFHFFFSSSGVSVFSAGDLHGLAHGDSKYLERIGKDMVVRTCAPVLSTTMASSGCCANLCFLIGAMRHVQVLIFMGLTEVKKVMAVITG